VNLCVTIIIFLLLIGLFLKGDTFKSTFHLILHKILLMKLAVVGATGLVGREILKVLEEREIHPSLFIPVASLKSIGTSITFNGQELKITGHEEAIRLRPDIAIFSAGGGASKEWAPKYAAAGITVIDNSSAWRMDGNIPLIVPEINASILTKKDKIIANPNCSTIQMVLALAPLHQKYRIRRIVVSTYQSVTGTGARAVRQLENERNGIKGEMAYPHPIDLNIIPHGGYFLDNGYTSEEVKLENETRKILGDPEIGVSATVVRVPVFGGHSEAVNVEFHREFDLKDVLAILSSTIGIVIQDDPMNNIYPMPLYSKGKDEVFVGRIRRDETRPNCLNLFIVSDNLRKGAATNAVQIAQYLLGNDLPD
jgi:aspartate-semialdehyde dehydrogenase